MLRTLRLGVQFSQELLKCSYVVMVATLLAMEEVTVQIRLGTLNMTANFASFLGGRGRDKLALYPRGSVIG